MKQSVVLLALLLLFGQEGNGSWMDTTTIGDPENPGDLYDIGNPSYPEDDVYLGGVDYVYQVGTYEVTVNQYTEFLNAKGQSDSYGLYSTAMGGGTPEGAFITRSGTDGSYSYSAVSGTESQPVRWVSFFDGVRFCNWLSNGRGDGDTETGSYTLSLGLSVTRESGATWVLPTEDEWYKAAYYDPDTGTYYDYPNGTDDVPSDPTNQTDPRVMNFGDDPYWQGGVYFTSTGETTGQSPFGTCDQGGNVAEWLETGSAQFPNRLIRGGSFLDQSAALSSGQRDSAHPETEGIFGFRVAYVIPEPSTFLMLALGGLGLLLHGRKRKQSLSARH